ncbi:glutamine synthetase I [Ehrlichia ruminantium]|uniref:Glutamine synthetase I beta n=1 Tax=Ehrlichia ruminantium (strain Welgevonden) TaxID=254945 RepID=A0A0H3LYY7_EHRRW|nr:type I glutamate--ammonia ligase [Ehrlichia ruminantium]QLK51987.1 type I glutamate--ammonia ligase [Ehrlichia ruminantium]QLK53819.1 type I glutamate--ammonia ligase [Ehrlichia ruminantium]QLK54733.1 type I glutamate--ammonia ligase [Ehrlichia ruminantium]QLK55653.1 type I glutamate--ammonia ligase [Ehrlichia ruminantium]QLK56572.1 type I glutamate--ammonia ligase [Ehrlichia ruminantium]
MFLSAEDTLNYIKKNTINFVDLRFTDSTSRWHHITRNAETINTYVLSSGVNFDSSSIPGWQSVEKSDMILLPDVSTAFVDPFTAQPTLVIICNVINPYDKSEYPKDPRYTAHKASQYMLSTGIADKCYFGPEVEFFVFDNATFYNGMYHSYFKIESSEHISQFQKREHINNSHCPKIKGGYMPTPPVDSLHDLRSEILTMLKEVGITPLIHHHEVAASQCEVGFQHDELIRSADNVQKCKYIIHGVASSYGKTATFMPKPVIGDNGSGMHCHQSLWKDNINIFVNSDGSMSEICLYYIGGIIKYGKAINAFTNPSTNSYKRLVPNFEAPTWLTYSYENRSSAIRIPYVPNTDLNAKRIEVRFPDPLANPYLCFSAQLMAGLYGIKNKIHPGPSIDKNLYTLDKKELQSFISVANSLEESLDALDNNREFLLEGDVFTNDQIDTYIKLKSSEVRDLHLHPHPIEFINYYSS